MLRWHHQLKDVLLIQDRLMTINEQPFGINEEINFWQIRLTDLHRIRHQLQRRELRNIIQVLILSKSAYIQQFLHIENEMQVKEYTTFIFIFHNNFFLIINNYRNSSNM